MSARIVPRARLNEILAFLKSRGVMLTDEGIELLKKRLEEEPVGKPTLERSKMITRNSLFRDILDRTFIKRSEKIQRFADNNPLLQLIDEKRKSMENTADKPVVRMPEHLRKIFYDEDRWQPFFPFLHVPPDGQIVKVIEQTYPDAPYIGYVRKTDGVTFIYTTRRKIDSEQMPEAKYYRLKEGIFQYEIDDVKNYEKGYYDYIMLFHK